MNLKNDLKNKTRKNKNKNCFKECLLFCHINAFKIIAPLILHSTSKNEMECMFINIVF